APSCFHDLASLRGQRAVDSGQWAESSGQIREEKTKSSGASIAPVLSLLLTAHFPLHTAYYSLIRSHRTSQPDRLVHPCGSSREVSTPGFGRMTGPGR